MRFQILTAVSVKKTALWDILSCSLAEVDRRFRGALLPPSTRFHRRDEGGTSSMHIRNVDAFQETTLRCIPEGYHLH
jgi:hypothetical protein